MLAVSQEVVEVDPEELGTEDAIRRRASLDRGSQVALIVRLVGRGHAEPGSPVVFL
jgi:hypothetical protein